MKKPLVELDLTLPSGREVYAECYSVQPAEPDVGIMSAYIDDFAVFDGKKEISDKLTDAEIDFVIEKFFEELAAMEEDYPEPEDDLDE